MDMNTAQIREAIAPVLRRYGISRAEIFGSVARGDATSASDVDVLVTIGRPMGMLSYVRMKRELENALGKNVDIITERNMNKFIEPHIRKDMQVVYEG